MDQRCPAPPWGQCQATKLSRSSASSQVWSTCSETRRCPPRPTSTSPWRRARDALHISEFSFRLGTGRQTELDSQHSFTCKSVWLKTLDSILYVNFLYRFLFLKSGYNPFGTFTIFMDDSRDYCRGKLNDIFLQNTEQIDIQYITQRRPARRSDSDSSVETGLGHLHVLQAGLRHHLPGRVWLRLQRGRL